MDSILNKVKKYISVLKPWTLLILVGVSSLFLYTINLGEAPFVDYDEAIYAEVIRESVASGNPFTLTLDGRPWFEKPPLYFFAVMATDKVLHPFSNAKLHPTEFSARLPSALAGVGCIILVWLIIFQKTRNKRLATLAALILLTTGTFIDNVRQVKLEAPVSAAILFTYYSYIRLIAYTKWKSWMWIALSIGVMLKSVIGLLALPIVLIDMIVSDGPQDLFKRLSSFLKGKSARIGMLVALIIVIPWHLYQTILYGSTFWNHYVLVHVVERFSGNLFVSTVTPAQFLGWFIGGAVPWSIMLICFIPLYFTPRFFMDRERYRLFIASTISSFAILLLFSASQTKALSYLTPLYPFMAVAIALGIEAIYHHFFRERVRGHLPKLFTVLACFVVGITAISTSVIVGFKRIDSLEVTTQLAREEENIGDIIRTESTSDIPVAFVTSHNMETVRFYSGGRKMYQFEKDEASSTSDYYIVAPRAELPHVLNSFAVKFASNFTVKYIGDLLTLIKVGNIAEVI